MRSPFPSYTFGESPRGFSLSGVPVADARHAGATLKASCEKGKVEASIVLPDQSEYAAWAPPNGSQRLFSALEIVLGALKEEHQEYVLTLLPSITGTPLWVIDLQLYRPKEEPAMIAATIRSALRKAEIGGYAIPAQGKANRVGVVVENFA